MFSVGMLTGIRSRHYRPVDCGKERILPSEEKQIKDVEQESG